MKDAARIRIAAAVTTLFIGALAGTGVVLRNANSAAPPGVDPSGAAATASAPTQTGAGPRPQVAVSRTSPAIGGSAGGAKPVVRRERHEPNGGGEALYD
jgi:hypothetical protein